MRPGYFIWSLSSADVPGANWETISEHTTHLLPLGRGKGGLFGEKICTYDSICTYEHMCLCIYVYIYIYIIYIHILYICVFVSYYMYIYIYMCRYIHISIWLRLPRKLQPKSERPRLIFLDKMVIKW
jgi:hypothetical protein